VIADHRMKFESILFGAVLLIAPLWAGCAAPYRPATVASEDPWKTQTVNRTPAASTSSVGHTAPLSPSSDASGSNEAMVVRSQSPQPNQWPGNSATAGGGDTFEQPMAASGGEIQPVQYTYGGTAEGDLPGQAQVAPHLPPNERFGPQYGSSGYGPTQYGENPTPFNSGGIYPDTGFGSPNPGSLAPPIDYDDLPSAPLIIDIEETETGRLMFGVGVNSNAGLTGNVVIDEYNFDWRRVPRSFGEIVNGQGFRGGGQRLRLEAIPGTVLQRYMFNYSDGYLGHTRISFNLSGFLYNRRFQDWDEARAGGRVGFGYRLTPDLTAGLALRLEGIDIDNIRVPGVPQLDAATGSHDLYGFKATLAHDTRDSPFAATEGHLLEFGFEQVGGSFSYPRGTVDYRRFLLITQRPDESGRQVLSFSLRAGISGPDTPIFENFFAGGFSTLRGFNFRGASPRVGTVDVGGRMQLLGSVEYQMPLTADDMLKGVVFVDFGTVEQDIAINSEDFRVAPGFGLRISVPAMGPAPIAFDFAFPIAEAATDDKQMFSFNVGLAR